MENQTKTKNLITVALFARFRGKGDVFDILKIGHAEPNIVI